MGRLMLPQAAPRGVETPPFGGDLEQQCVAQQIRAAIQVLPHSTHTVTGRETLEPGRRRVEAPAMLQHAGTDALAQTERPSCELSVQRCGAGGDELGRRRRRGCAPIGRQIGDRRVGLVSDPRDHRQPGRSDRTRHRLGVEGHQVFERAAATNQQDHAGTGHLVGPLDRPRYRLGRALPLHRRRREDDVDARRTPRHHRVDITEGGSGA